MIDNMNNRLPDKACPKPKAILCIQDDALDHIALENMKIIYRFRSDKIKVVGCKVGFPGHGFLLSTHSAHWSDLAIRPSGIRYPYSGIWQSLIA